MQVLSGALVKRLINKSGFTRPRDAGHADKTTNRYINLDIFQIVPARAAQANVFTQTFVALFRDFNFLALCEIARGKRPGAAFNFLDRALRDNLAAKASGAGTDINKMVGGAYRRLVVFYDDDRITQIAQVRHRREQAFVVALVQTNRRLVEHIHHAGQPRADLTGKTNTLRFAARQGFGFAVQR